MYMTSNTRKWREYPLMAATAIIIASSIIFAYDRYTSPDRIEEKPILDINYIEIQKDAIQHETNLNQFFQKELLQQLEPRHWSPESDLYKNKFNTLCYTFRSLCDRIDIHGSFNEKDRYFYTAIPIYLTYYMDRYGNFDYNMVDIIDTILISANYGRRGYANQDSIIINTQTINSIREYLSIMTHELGHVVDLGAVTGTMRRKDTTYTEFGQVRFSLDDPSLDYYRLSRANESTRNAGQTRNDFCSGYGQRNPFEDFSECMNLYINHHDLFEHITSRSSTLRRKYTYIKRLFDGFYLYRNTAAVRQYPNPSDFYVFDTSKIWE